LLQEQGCCIVYTHFGAGFMTKGRLNPQTIHLLKTLAQKNGWFVPVSELLDFLLEQKPKPEISRLEKKRLVYRWIWEKVWERSANMLNAKK